MINTRDDEARKRRLIACLSFMLLPKKGGDE
jgi:hypothetical protein